MLPHSCPLSYRPLFVLNPLSVNILETASAGTRNKIYQHIRTSPSLQTPSVTKTPMDFTGCASYKFQRRWAEDETKYQFCRWENIWCILEDEDILELDDDLSAMKSSWSWPPHFSIMTWSWRRARADQSTFCQTVSVATSPVNLRIHTCHGPLGHWLMRSVRSGSRCIFVIVLFFHEGNIKSSRNTSMNVQVRWPNSTSISPRSQILRIRHSVIYILATVRWILEKCLLSGGEERIFKGP